MLQEKICDLIIDVRSQYPEAILNAVSCWRGIKLLLMPVTWCQRHIVALDINGLVCTMAVDLCKNSDAFTGGQDAQKLSIIHR